MRLATVSDLKTFLEKEDSVHDVLLGMIIEAVSSSFETYTNRKFEKQSRTEYFDTGGKIFRVRAFPIDSSISTVVIVDTITAVIDDDYYIHFDKGYIEFIGDTAPGIGLGPRQVSITYTGGFGWSVGSGRVDAPTDLSFACLLQAAFIYKNRRNLGAVSISLPDGSISSNVQGEFLPQVQSVLDRYKIC